MEGQLSSGKYTLPNFAQDLHVMLVDHDPTSLNKIKAKLEKFSYQVTGVNNASEALSMIWENKTSYKFVIANVTLPKMDYGSFVHELCQKEIPLIWMSRSYDEAKQTLLDGASSFLRKPISSNDLKPLWQLPFRRRSNQKESHGGSGSAARLDLLENKLVVKKEQVNERDKEEGLITATNNQQEGSKHKRLIDHQQGNLQDKRTKYNFFDKSELNQDETGRRGDGNRNAKGRERTLWHPTLESKFQAAYRELGDRATPKSILEKMNDPSIKLTQVASHLQKFRSSVQNKNVDSGATSLPVTNNSSSSLAGHPGDKNLPNFPPCANQNQDLDTNFAGSFSTRHQSQLPEGGVAATTELLGSAQARVTSGIATNPDNLSNFGDGIQNTKPMVELGPEAGLPNIPPNANQNQDVTTNFAATFNSNRENQLPAGIATTTETLGFDQANIITPGIATNSENVPTNFTHGMQNVQRRVEMAPAAGSSRHSPYSNQTQYQNQSLVGVATTELLGSGQITSGIATNSENFRMNFRDGIQNVQPRVEMAPAAGSSRHPPYSNQTQYQNQFPAGVATTELLGSGQITSGIATNSENFRMNFKDGIQNVQPRAEMAPAAGSSRHPPYSNQTQCQNQLPAGVATTELLGSGQITSGIATNSENFRMNFRDGIQNVQPRVEMAPAAGSSRHPPYSNQTQCQNQLPAGVATTELLGSEQITSGIATNSENFRMNFRDGIQNVQPRAEMAPAAGSSRHPPYSNQTQCQNQLPAGVATTELLGSEQITSGIATNSENFRMNFRDGIQNVQPRAEMAPAAGSSRHPPYSNQTQYQNQFPAGVATTELLGSGQITSGIATNSENFRMNFKDGIQNVQPRVEMAPAAGSSRHPPYSNQTQYQNQFPARVATTELLGYGQITSGIATNSENFQMNFRDGIQNVQPRVEMAPAAGSSRHPPYSNQTQYQNQFPAGVATTELLGSGQITAGIATNSENFRMNFRDGIQNVQPRVEMAFVAGSSRHPAYANQNQDLNTIRAAPFSTRHQSQLQEGAVAGTTEPVGSVQGETTSGIVIEAENFLMNGSGGIQNDERIVEEALAAGSSNQNQPQSEHAGVWTIFEDETVDLDGIFDSINPGDIEQNREPMMEETLAGASSNQNQPLSKLADIVPTSEGEAGFGWCS